MTLPKGELEIDKASERPIFIESWPVERKAEEFRKWLLLNFETEGEGYSEFLFEEFENSEELSDELNFEQKSLAYLLDDVWGHLLVGEDFKLLYAVLRDKLPDEWWPSSSRVSVNEAYEEESIEDLIERLPDIDRRLAEIEKRILGNIGHNRPPKAYEISNREIAEARKIISELVTVSSQEAKNENTKLKRLGVLCTNIGAQFLKYTAQKADVFVDEFVKSSAPLAGKLTAAGLAYYLLGDGILRFGETLLKLLN